MENLEVMIEKRRNGEIGDKELNELVNSNLNFLKLF